MKKLFVTILTILYISTSTGATFHIHYCMGKFADWGMGHNLSKTCGKCGMEKSPKINNGCCKDENKIVKITTDQKVSQNSFQLAQLIAVSAPVSFIEMTLYDFSSITEENPISHAPPGSSSIAVYARNCVFLI